SKTFVSITTISTAALHCVIQSVAIGDVHAESATVEGRQRPKFFLFQLLASLEEKPQCPFDQFRHRFVLMGCFAAKPRHDRICDIEGWLHTANHIGYMAVCQTSNLNRPTPSVGTHPSTVFKPHLKFNGAGERCLRITCPLNCGVLSRSRTT